MGANFPRTYGIYQVKGGGRFTENKCSDLTYSYLVNSALYPTNIESNEIEINEPAITSLAAIYINNSIYPVIEINQNEIYDNTHQYLSPAAIYSRTSSNVSMVGNKIFGFKNGILGIYSRNTHIANNDINQCESIGIYFYSPPNDNSIQLHCL
ncbi:MAG: right-handed parallel beta-helix repeat-containing protein [Bacteroidales bacterium]